MQTTQAPTTTTERAPSAPSPSKPTAPTTAHAVGLDVVEQQLVATLADVDRRIAEVERTLAPMRADRERVEAALTGLRGRAPGRPRGRRPRAQSDPTRVGK